MGGHPPYGQGTGEVPGPGGAASDGEAPAVEIRREVGVKLGGNDKGGGGFTDIWRRQNAVPQYIATQLLLDLCKGTERTPGAWVGMRC